MIVKFNPTGTHVHKDFLKIRLDLYPEATDKTYPIHYVDHYDREPTQEELDNPTLLALIPTHKELNPCLCHFIKINPDITLTDLIAIIKTIFDATTVSKLDTLSSELKPDYLEQLRSVMSSKLGKGNPVTTTKDGKFALITAELDKFVGLEVIV